MKRAVLFIGSDDTESNVAVQDTATAGGRELLQATEQEACRSLADRRDDIEAVIIDLGPGQPAVNLLRTMTQSETAPPVIVLAETEQLGAVPMARQGGAAACVRKPFTVEKLTSIIEQVCSPEPDEQGWTSDVWGHPHRRLITPTA